MASQLLSVTFSIFSLTCRCLYKRTVQSTFAPPGWGYLRQTISTFVESKLRWLLASLPELTISGKGMVRRSWTSTERRTMVRGCILASQSLQLPFLAVGRECTDAPTTCFSKDDGQSPRGRFRTSQDSANQLMMQRHQVPENQVQILSHNLSIYALERESLQDTGCEWAWTLSPKL